MTNLRRSLDAAAQINREVRDARAAARQQEQDTVAGRILGRDRATGKYRVEVNGQERLLRPVTDGALPIGSTQLVDLGAGTVDGIEAPPLQKRRPEPELFAVSPQGKAAAFSAIEVGQGYSGPGIGPFADFSFVQQGDFLLNVWQNNGKTTEIAQTTQVLGAVTARSGYTTFNDGNVTALPAPVRIRASYIVGTSAPVSIPAEYFLTYIVDGIDAGKILLQAFCLGVKIVEIEAFRVPEISDPPINFSASQDLAGLITSNPPSSNIRIRRFDIPYGERYDIFSRTSYIAGGPVVILEPGSYPDPQPYPIRLIGNKVILSLTKRTFSESLPSYLTEGTVVVDYAFLGFQPGVSIESEFFLEDQTFRKLSDSQFLSTFNDIDFLLDPIGPIAQDLSVASRLQGESSLFLRIGTDGTAIPTGGFLPSDWQGFPESAQIEERMSQAGVQNYSPKSKKFFDSFSPKSFNDLFAPLPELVESFDIESTRYKVDLDQDGLPVFDRDSGSPVNRDIRAKQGVLDLDGQGAFVVRQDLVTEFN